MSADTLSLIFSALADPNRRKILLKLTQGDSSVKDILPLIDLKPPTVTQHLKVLENAGLIERAKNAQLRPCKLKREALDLALGHLAEIKKLWEKKFQALDDLLENLHKKEGA